MALEVGFSSGEAFSRAFKQHFSVTLSTWRSTEPKRWHRRLNDVRERRLRELSNPDQTHIPAFDDPDAFIHLKELTMNVTLKELPPVRVAYLRYIGPYGPGIGTFWRDSVAPGWSRTACWAACVMASATTIPTSPHPKMPLRRLRRSPRRLQGQRSRHRHHPARRPLRRRPLSWQRPRHRRRLDRTVP